MIIWPKQPVSRVLFPRQVTLSEGDGHSSGTVVTDGLKQPTRKHGRAILDASLFGLAPGGVYLASGVTVGPGELLPHPFTLTRRGGRTSLCGTFPGVAPAGRYPAPCPVEPGLSSPPKGAAVTWPAPAKPFRLRQKSICGVASRLPSLRSSAATPRSGATARLASGAFYCAV